jgi:hypothetical protein
MVQLEELFEPLLAGLPIEAEGRELFTSETFAKPPIEIEARKLKLFGHNLGHDYGDSARYDMVVFFADKPTYRRLGLLVLASLFHPNSTVSVHLTHPKSQVKTIRLECWSPSSGACGLFMVPSSYAYVANPVHHLHPLWHEDGRIEGCHKRRNRWDCDFPSFYLTNEGGRSMEFLQREYVDGFGSPYATATIAALLLDIGLPDSTARELCLESPSGNWSVAIGSAEARFYVHNESDPDCAEESAFL